MAGPHIARRGPSGWFFAYLVISCLASHAQVVEILDAPQTTSASPLSILQAAPKVRLDEPNDPALIVEPQQKPELRKPKKTPVAEKKPGIVRGMIRAIPFLGPRIAGQKETPAPDTTHDMRIDEGPQPSTPVDTTRLNLEAAPTKPATLFAPEPEAIPSTAEQPVRPDGVPAPPVVSESSVLSVKTVGRDTVATPTIASGVKQPAFVRENHDVVTTATARASQTSPTLEAADLGMPNPAYEQNEVIRTEYVDAVKAAREGHYSQAAQLFREYAANHSSSGLTPRALFLAALIEPLPEKSEEAEKTLRERFPTSRFLSELEKRNRSRAKAMTTATPVVGESPARMAARLENELTEVVGNLDREVPLRLRLGQAYLGLEEYERALEVMKPALDGARGRAEEPDILILISECYIATHRNQQAVTLLSDVLQRFPAAPQRPRALYDYGLVNEASGNFERARTMYSELRQKWPASAEAAQAVQRLNDMDRLAE